MNKNNVRDPFMSTSEVGKYLGVSGDTVRKWIAERRITFMSVGRCIRIRKSEADAFIKRNTKEKEITGRLFR